MCLTFLRISPKHAPLTPPGAAPTLTTIYDRPFLDTTVDMENPTSHGIVQSLNVDEKLHPLGDHSGEDIQLQPIRGISAEELREQGERKGSMPKGRKASRCDDGDKHSKRRPSRSTAEKS